jgi:hypothetical protein
MVRRGRPGRITVGDEMREANGDQAIRKVE